jgi:hypothetical protein
MPPFDLACTASSGLPVTYTKVLGPFTLEGNTFSTLGAPGNVTIYVDQAGNDNYFAASSYMLQFSIEMPNTQKEIPDDKKIILFPNPSNGVFNISSNQSYLAGIYNMLGQLVFTVRLACGTGEYDLSGLNPGIYLLKTENQVIRIVIL